MVYWLLWVQLVGLSWLTVRVRVMVTVVQLVERPIVAWEVAGSSPVSHPASS